MDKSTHGAKKKRQGEKGRMKGTVKRKQQLCQSLV